MNTIEPLPIAYRPKADVLLAYEEEPILSIDMSNTIDPKIQKRNEYARNYYRKKYQENEEYRLATRERIKKAYRKKKNEFDLLKKLHKDCSLLVVV